MLRDSVAVAFAGTARGGRRPLGCLCRFTKAAAESMVAIRV